MGDSSRLKILHCVSQGDVCVCDLSAVLGMNVSAVSHQLRLLRTLNLVKPRRAGRIVYYSPSDHHVGGMMKNRLGHERENRRKRAETLLRPGSRRIRVNLGKSKGSCRSCVDSTG